MPKLVASIPAPDHCSPQVMAAPLGDDDAEALAGGFKALADPVRLRLLSLIAAAPGGTACSCDLEAPVGKSQPTVSHHLAGRCHRGRHRRVERRGING